MECIVTKGTSSHPPIASDFQKWRFLLHFTSSYSVGWETIKCTFHFLEKMRESKWIYLLQLKTMCVFESIFFLLIWIVLIIPHFRILVMREFQNSNARNIVAHNSSGIMTFIHKNHMMTVFSNNNIFNVASHFCCIPTEFDCHWHVVLDATLSDNLTCAAVCLWVCQWKQRELTIKWNDGKKP